MTCLRKVVSINRLVMVTTLTRQSVRAILELACPGNNKIGNPFMPVRACVVDTLPVGPHFELVILMQRRPIYLITSWMQKILDKRMKVSQSEASNSKGTEESTCNTRTPQPLVRYRSRRRKAFSPKKGKTPVVTKNSQQQSRFVENIMSTAKFKGKRPHSPERTEDTPKKFPRKIDKFKSPRPESILKPKERIDEKPQFRINPLYEKTRDNKDQSDLREKLTSNRIESDIIQQVKEHQTILNIAKEKLSGPAPTVDIATAKQLQNMLNMVLEQTNKLQNQLPPRSVWDRIAPPENIESTSPKETQDTLLKGRFVQETGNQDIVITTSNQNFIENDKSPPFKKYHNIPPLEPNLISPVKIGIELPSERFHATDFRKSHPGNIWNRDKMDRSRWNESNNLRKPPSPVRGFVPPLRHRVSPKRSPPRRHASPVRRPPSPFRSRSPIRRQFSPPRRPGSPMRRPMSPPGRQHGMMPQQRRQMSPVNRMMSSSSGRDIFTRRPMMQQESGPSMRRGGSPFRPQEQRQLSPPRRQLSPKRQSPLRQLADEWDIPSRGAIEENSWSRDNERAPDKIWHKERTQSNNWDQHNKDLFISKSVNQDNWDITDSSHDGRWISSGGDNWNNKQLPGKPSHKESWPQNSDSRWQCLNPGASGDNWNIRGKESFSNREENWSDNPRWESSNYDNRNQADKDDWNELPEDARDPWGDDNPVASKERWQKSEISNFSSNWVRESDRNNSWQSKSDSWQNKGEFWKSKNDPWSKDDAWQNTDESWQKKPDSWQKKIDPWQNKNDSWQNKPHSSWQNKEEPWDKGYSWKNKGPPSLASKSQWSNSSNQNAGSSRWLSQNEMVGNSPLLAWQEDAAEF